MIAVGVLGGVVALGANIVTEWVLSPAVETPPVAASGIEVRKAGGLNVPILRNGELLGYVVIQLGYTIDSSKATAPEGAISGLLLDEAFRTIYSDDKLDPKTLERYDLNGLISHLRSRLGVRAGGEGIKDVLVQEFNFVPIGSFK